VLLTIVEILCKVFICLLCTRAIWVACAFKPFSQLPSKFHTLRESLPKETLYDPLGRRLHILLRWHTSSMSLTWGSLVYLLGRARLNARVLDALEGAYLGEVLECVPHIAEYEQLVGKGLCYQAPIISRLFLLWYLKKTGRLFLALESIIEVQELEGEGK
jgi:hypothetical protein